MSKINLAIVGIILVTVSIGCKSLIPSRATETSKQPAIDFTTPGKALDVKVTLDKKQTASGKVSPGGGTVSLTAADGSKFTLDVPANAVETETTITMTALKSLDGAPLDNNTPTAVQLEPSGLFFKELATLTIVPAKEIPIKEQIMFSYSSEGKDYHLAPVDPKSKEIKIKLIHFSGAGVGSGGDAAWAANLMVIAAEAQGRLEHIIGESTQEAHRRMLLGDEDSAELNDLIDKAVAAIDKFEEQVLLKQMVAAELDCQHVEKAIQSLIFIGRMYDLLGGKPPSWNDKMNKLLKITEDCKWAYQIVGGLDDWQTNTRVCDVMKPFTLSGSCCTLRFSGGMTGTYSYSGIMGAHGTGTYVISLPGGPNKPGTMIGAGDGVAGGASGSGTEKYTLTPLGPCKE